MIINLKQSETNIFVDCFNSDVLNISSKSIADCLESGSIQAPDKKWIQTLKMNYSKSKNKGEDFDIYSHENQLIFSITKNNKDQQIIEDLSKHKFTYPEQVSILLSFYIQVDQEKTETDIIALIDRRRNKGDPKGTRIPSKPWKELCDKLETKYKIHPFLFYEKDTGPTYSPGSPPSSPQPLDTPNEGADAVEDDDDEDDGEDDGEDDDEDEDDEDDGEDDGDEDEK